jgi:oxalate decarboxylase/phosphoglucose isomerase-like protein (cupin superfamily)
MDRRSGGRAGVVARAGAAHGVVNDGTDPLVLLVVVTPPPPHA